MLNFLKFHEILIINIVYQANLTLMSLNLHDQLHTYINIIFNF